MRERRIYFWLALTINTAMGVRKRVYQSFVRLLIFLGKVLNTFCVRRTDAQLGNNKLNRRYSVRKEIIYTSSDWEQEVKGDLYLPEVVNSQQSAVVEDKPVVLLVHGGGWADNDNRYQMVDIAERLVSNGFVVFNVTYRLAPEYHFPAPVDDLLEALKWLKNHDEELGVNMMNTALYGYSAGGHLVELAAMREMPKGVNIKAVVAGGTPHFVRLDPDFYMVKDFMGHQWQDDPERYRDATPVDRVSEDFPPVFIYHGEKDVLVPRPHVDKWEDRLKDLEIEHEIHWVIGRGHIGTFLCPRESISRAIHFLRLKLG